MALLIALWIACLPAFAEDWAYRVRPGDTIWDLAGEYLKPDVPWQRLQEYNRITNPYQLPPGSTLRIPLAWLNRQPARAKVVAVRGDAVATDKGQNAPITAGMSLGTGAVLKTSPEASLSLQFADGSRLMLLGDSELLLDRLTRFGRSGMADTRLRLQRGRISNEVRPTRGPAASFIVDTPSASSAVRGTQFRVESSQAVTYTEVLEGRVAVSSPRNSALVKRGYGTVVAAGQAAIKPVALLPAPDLSRVAPTHVRAQPELAWPAVENARQYRVQVADNRRFDTLLADLETATPTVALPTLEEGAYFLRVRAVDADGLEGLDAVVPFRIEGQPEPPYTIAPTEAAVVRTSAVRFQWTKAPAATGYQYEIAGDGDFTAPVAQATTKDRTSAEIALPPGEYAWRIRSVDAGGKAGPYSDALAFTVRPLAEVTDIDSSAAGQSRRDVTFRWPAGQPGQRYRFQMSRTADFKEPQIDRTVDTAEITLPRLRTGTWYLRAQTIDVDGFEGPMPPPQIVEVPCRLCKIGIGAGALLILLAL
ncbi:FecR domain-containing protein [Pseudoxanthomonas putridarboris]|uniref:FecR domain-containing protein n=1 Tax=Pseudoxanthomonas putridarboris TaxID=752605 RepID=A0ABU9IY00_9GAMM